MKLDAVRQDQFAAPAAQPRVGERLSVRVERLRLDAEVGVYASEHGRKQPITVSLEATVDEEAVKPDADLSHAVNYASLAEIVRQVTASRHHELLEDLVQHIADVIFTDPHVCRLSLRVDKLTALDDADSVGVSYERWR